MPSGVGVLLGFLLIPPKSEAGSVSSASQALEEPHLGEATTVHTCLRIAAKRNKTAVKGNVLIRSMFSTGLWGFFRALNDYSQSRFSVAVTECN